MTTLTEWAELTDEERQRRSAEKRAAYVIASLEAMHNAAHITHTTTSRPYIAHGCWYVRSGSCCIPFSTYEDAHEFTTQTHQGATT